MGLKYGPGRYFGTRGSIVKQYYQVSSKQKAKDNISLLPTEVQKSAKSFWNNASKNYDNFTASLDTAGNTVLIMENPGKVPGSRAAYIKVIDKDGKVSVYKETYDQYGNLVHTKPK